MVAMVDKGKSWSLWRIAGWTFAGLLLLLPLVAMQFTDEVKWDGLDFIFAAVMIGGTGLAFELAVRASASFAYRFGVAVALAAGFLLIWINGAVGIIGDEDNPANLMYGGVLAAALIGAIVARFRPAGMVRAMLVAASAQALIAAIASIGGLGASEPPGPLGILALNGFFVLLWLFSAAMFRKAEAF
jgi:hypothetical protein